MALGYLTRTPSSNVSLFECFPFTCNVDTTHTYIHTIYTVCSVYMCYIPAIILYVHCMCMYACSTLHVWLEKRKTWIRYTQKSRERLSQRGLRGGKHKPFPVYPRCFISLKTYIVNKVENRWLVIILCDFLCLFYSFI